MLNIAVGLAFSGGLLDLFLFGILQGNEKDKLAFDHSGYYLFLLILFYLLIPDQEDEFKDTGT